ncbi:unnamed protein product [Parascedosporium putredinis]|uniref:Uncharacterized protein n=1 Tax=Parascedosporium putredinis TaxID=1442378 RepID=A0A9P1H2Q2_9PEZI|nr:unnamed protein product [Parascedosporium putredinis]CAI7995110.1 unnamed protein product [Parascedosporium putredinis]
MASTQRAPDPIHHNANLAERPSRPSRPSPVSNTTAPSRTDGAAHAEQTTREWQPTFTRRESWSPEDRKRLMQMKGIREEDIQRRAS